MTYACPNCGQQIEMFIAGEVWCSACPDRPLMIETSTKDQEREQAAR